MPGALTFLREYVPCYSLAGTCIDASIDEEPQDTHISTDAIKPGQLAETDPPPAEVCANALEATATGERGYPRERSLFSLFLDGTRRTYPVGELRTAAGRLLPVFGGQISAAVLRRDQESGLASVFYSSSRRLMVLPGGGKGLNQGDVRELGKKLIEGVARLEVVEYRVRAEQPPQEAAIARINAEMQHLEIGALGDLATRRLLGNSSMMVIDGSVQFENIPKEDLYLLRYVIGVSKTFRRDLSFLRNGLEVGALVAQQLRRIGDRTAAFRFKRDEVHQYAMWYLRIRSRTDLGSPLDGVVKVEKLLVTDDERQRGLPSDVVNNISASLVGERYVTPYGKDSRWQNLLYPIFLAEVLQRSKMLSDLHFLRLF